MRLGILLTLFAAVYPLGAAPWTARQLENAYPGIELRTRSADFTLNGQRVLVLFTEEGELCGIISDKGNTERLNTESGLRAIPQTDAAGISIALADAYRNNPPRRPLGQEAPAALAWFMQQSYYHPTALTDDGALLWASGKRRSLDVLLPLAQEGAIRQATITADMEVNTFAANVLAKKLGYPEDNGSAGDKRALGRSLHCGHVLYGSAKRNTVIFSKNGTVCIALRDATELQEHPQLGYPVVTKRQPKSVSTPTPAMSPREALRAYINRLMRL